MALAYSVPAAPLLQVGGLVEGFNLIEPSVEELPHVIPPATVAPLNSVLLPSRRRVLEKAANTNCTVTVIKIMIIPMEIPNRIFFIL
ncbi:MAG: hypothetical protein NTY06_00050 [Candidatus Gottesmanbacteria bacterium]|nr:hypothetical protein [Candidatus Gottesmanbacteria bacterium]